MAAPTATVSADSAPVRSTLLRVPTSFRQAGLLARYQLIDYLRSRRFILMLAIVATIGGIFTAVVGYYRPPSFLAASSNYYSAFWGGGATYVIIFAGVIFGADAIAGEFQNKTGYFLMGLPVRRATVYAGKYIAAFLASFTALLVFALLLLANGVYYFGGGAFTVAFFESFLLAVGYLLALLGTTFLFSSLFKTSTYATLVVAVLFLFGFSLFNILLENLVNIEPWMIVTYASGVIGNVFDNPYPAHIVTRDGITLYTPTIVEGVGIMLGYFVLTSLLGLVLFEREEFA